MTTTQEGTAVNARLVRDVRILKLYAGATTLALAALGLTAAKTPDPDAEITVERINIVDPTGVKRMVISNAERFPLPKVEGRELPRAMAPAGLVLYDSKGNEVGGVAASDASFGKMNVMAFDYPNYDAIGLLTRISPDGSDALAGLAINARPPANLDPIAAGKVAHTRIAIQNQNEDAQILMADPQGRDRIRLMVDRKGQARIEVLNADGKVTFRAPEGG
jgi:hypothetical protein